MTSIATADGILESTALKFPEFAQSAPDLPPEVAAKQSLVQIRGQRELLGLFFVCIVPFVPLLLNFLVSLWQRPHYQFFPIVFLAA